jgi:hypothetical protein
MYFYTLALRDFVQIETCTGDGGNITESRQKPELPVKQDIKGQRNCGNAEDFRHVWSARSTWQN